MFKFSNQGTKEVIVSTANWVLVGILITIGDVTRNIAIRFLFQAPRQEEKGPFSNFQVLCVRS